MLASSRMALCGQPPVSTPTMRSSGSTSPPRQKLGVLAGVDVVGDDGEVVSRPEFPAQALHEGRLARADRAADAEREDAAPGSGVWTRTAGAVRRIAVAAVEAVRPPIQDRNSRVYRVGFAHNTTPHRRGRTPRRSPAGRAAISSATRIVRRAAGREPAGRGCGRWARP